MGILSFISKLFGLGRRFKGTSEQYLGMVQYMAFKNNPNFTASELLQWGDVLQKVMTVDLYPYKDFQDLASNGKADLSLITKVDGKLKEMQERRDLKQAIYGVNADLGDDDVMESDSDSAVFARQFVKDLSKHVNFPNDEQHMIDKL